MDGVFLDQYPDGYLVETQSPTEFGYGHSRCYNTGFIRV